MRQRQRRHGECFRNHEVMECTESPFLVDINDIKCKYGLLSSPYPFPNMSWPQRDRNSEKWVGSTFSDFRRSWQQKMIDELDIVAGSCEFLCFMRIVPVCMATQIRYHMKHKLNVTVTWGFLAKIRTNKSGSHKKSKLDLHSPTRNGQNAIPKGHGPRNALEDSPQLWQREREAMPWGWNVLPMALTGLMCSCISIDHFGMKWQLVTWYEENKKGGRMEKAYKLQEWMTLTGLQHVHQILCMKCAHRNMRTYCMLVNTIIRALSPWKMTCLIPLCSRWQSDINHEYHITTVLKLHSDHTVMLHAIPNHRRNNYKHFFRLQLPDLPSQLPPGQTNVCASNVAIGFPKRGRKHDAAWDGLLQAPAGASRLVAV